ncbi:SPOR domain-containing protein [Pyruvatibacter mobilis]|uniref:SPOR domain-containing protein n=1 Tax=Pyruvatibacter mobilis TaxID=1712261 RepID=UPI003BA8C803
MFAQLHTIRFGRLVASREALNTVLAAMLLVALILSMSTVAKAEDIAANSLESYDREMLTSLIEAVIAVDEGDAVITAAIPPSATRQPVSAMGPKSILPGRNAAVADARSDIAPVALQADPGFALQLGSFSSAENAQRGFEQANQQYASALPEHTLYVQPVDLGTRGVFHRLRIGGFESLPQASAACTSLGISAADCMIVSAAQQ